MTDEGFHEIQLNGKQLVFVFMAATVVAVVIFLCGVMVGRGVRVQRGGDVIATTIDPAADPTAAQTPAAAGTNGSGDGAPLSSQETLTYAERLGAPDPPVETLSAAPQDEAPDPTAPSRQQRAEPSTPATSRSKPSPAAAPPAAVSDRTAPPSAASSSASSSVTSSSAEPTGNGFVVQVAAVTERREADTIARRLGAKGYPAFVTTPAGAARVFRVRVGKFKERREAESIAARLEKEEQFKPWVTR